MNKRRKKWRGKWTEDWVNVGRRVKGGVKDKGNVSEREEKYRSEEREDRGWERSGDEGGE